MSEIKQAETDQTIEEPSVYIGKYVVLEGNIQLGEGASVWHHSTLRADTAPVKIGRNSNIQEGSIVHTDPGFPVVVGDNCMVGHRALLHGCTIEDDCLIGMGAIVMNGARIGRHSIVGAGALVLENMQIPEGSVVVGSPAKIIGSVRDEQIEQIHDNAKEYIESSQKQLQKRPASLFSGVCGTEESEQKMEILGQK